MAVHKADVFHNDVALNNFVWNGESVAVIDFGRYYVCTDLEQLAREADDLEMLFSQHESMSGFSLLFSLNLKDFFSTIKKMNKAGFLM